MVSNEALAEFKRIWKDEYGTDISDAEAMPKAVALLALFDLVYRPITKSQAEKYDTDDHGTPT